MAVTTPVTDQVASIEERTWRATIETPKGLPYYLSLHRERRNLDANGNMIGDPIPATPIVVKFNDIAAETVTVPVNGSNVTLTVADICNFLTVYFDQKATALSI